jgi:hypothetical protein
MRSWRLPRNAGYSWSCCARLLDDLAKTWNGLNKDPTVRL